MARLSGLAFDLLLRMAIASPTRFSTGFRHCNRAWRANMRSKSSLV
ncbi:hypothetical protein LN050_10830 [Comamonadaceae bacterium M7527]|nr:hypothetical protein LN050_10830 [Comamonadaceae bacterium M7527]